MKYILLLIITSSCAIVPEYRIEPNRYCPQRSYNTICRGYDETHYDAYPEAPRSIYDRY